MDIRVTTLSENTANSGFLAEWGISMLIEADGARILFDTSQSFTPVHNARTLGVDLKTVDKLVLSHGHYDHTGGLKAVLEETGPMEIVGHPDIWTEKYAVFGDVKRPIGIPFARRELEALGARFHLTPEPVWITDSIVTSGEIPMITEYETTDAYLCVREGDALVPDPFADDLALGIKSDSGLVVVLGCAHRGMINTIRHFQKLAGEDRVHAVLGGTHLLMASPEWLARATADLKEIGVERLGVSHCTGFNASCWLAGELPGVFFMNNSGTTFTVP